MSALAAICRAIDAINGTVGRAVAWLLLAMVLVQFAVVVMRYVFGIGFLMVQESIVYMHALVFMLAAAYTLLTDGHVRVDIFYRDAPPRTQAWINLLGTLLFLLPVCAVTWWVAYPYVARSWAILEGSRETSGIPAVFLLKTVILVFVVMLILQGLSLALRSLLVLLDRDADPNRTAGR